MSLKWLWEFCRPQMYYCVLPYEQRWDCCILKTAGALCPWRQWYVIGGFRSPWLYIDSVLLIAAARSYLQGLPPAIFSTRSAWHFCSKGVIHLWLPHTTGFWWLQYFPHLLESLSYSISFPVYGSIHATGQTHFCDLHVSFEPQQNQVCFIKKEKICMLRMPNT